MKNTSIHRYSLPFYKFSFILINILIWTSYAYTQCDPAPALDCGDAPIHCYVADINGYCTTLPNPPNATGPLPCQGGQGKAENTIWLAFIANGVDLTFTVFSSCSHIEAGILKGECKPNIQEEILCKGKEAFGGIGCPGTPLVLTSFYFEPGELYYLWVDGCDGEVCDITIGAPGGDAFKFDDLKPIEGPSVLCVGKTGKYTIPKVGGVKSYYWYLDGKKFGNPTKSNEINLSFPQVGVHQICVDVDGECIPVTDPPEKVCFDITVTDVYPIDPPAVYVCPGKSTLYNGKFYPAGKHKITFKSKAGCDSIITLEVISIDVPKTDLGVLYKCPGECVQIFDDYGNGGDFCQAVEKKKVTLQSWQGCDSTVTFTLRYVTIDPIIKPPVDIGCKAGIVDLDASGSKLLNYDTLDIKWKAFNGGFISGPVDTLKTFTSVPGTYCLYISGTSIDGLTCKDSACVIVKQIAVIPTAKIMVDTSICIKDSLTLYASSNIAGSKFSWTGPASKTFKGDSIIITQAGNYKLTAITPDSCVAFADFNIPALKIIPDVNATGDTLDCFTGKADLIGSSSSSPVNYQWFDPLGNQIANTKNVSVLQGGIYKLVVTNAVNGCSSDVTVESIPDNNTPDLSLSKSNDLDCNLLLTDLDASSTLPGIKYLWTGNSVNGKTTPSVSTALPGSYTVSVTNPANGCINSKTIVVSQDNSKPVLSAVTDTIKCSNNKTVLVDGTSSVNSNVLINWKDINGSTLSNTLDFSTSISQALTLLVTNLTNHCIDSVTLFVPQNIKVPDVTASGDVITCKEPLADALASSASAVSYLWSGPAGSAYSATTAKATGITIPGDYTVEVTDLVNGCTNSTSVTVTANTTIPDLQVSGGTLNCINNSQITITAQTSIADPGFKWVFPDGSTHTQQNPMVQDSGTYYVTVTDMQNGCIKTDDVSVVSDEEIPDLTVNNAVITCTKTTADLTAISNTPGVSFLWTGPGVPGSTTPTITIDKPGKFTCVVTAPNGCSKSAVSLVALDAVFPLAFAFADGEINCTHKSVGISTTGSSSGSNYIYSWTGPATANPNGASFSTEVPGFYYLNVLNTENGCSKDTFVEVLFNDNFITAISTALKDPACFKSTNGQIEITSVSGGTPPYLYSINNKPFSSNLLFSSLADGTYSLAVKDAVGCLYNLDVVLTEPPLLTVDAGRDTIINWGTPVELIAVPSAAGAYSVYWNPFLDSTCINCLNQNITLFNTQIFTVTIKNINDCSATDKILVVVKKERPVFIPNVFSPNADGINDVFFINTKEGVVDEIVDLEIFDRWGEKIFSESHFPPNDPKFGWKGNYRNKYVNPGVFVYWARIKFKDGETILYKGDVTVQH